MTTVRTAAATVTAELPRIKGSRFVARLTPVADEAAARAVIDEVLAASPEASHHCWAFRLADGLARSSDDGEPRGTAGPPILRHLEGADLQDVVGVVTRWYGGTPLGRGGLMRAYGDATAAVLAAAEVIEREVTAERTLTHAYDLSGALDGVLSTFDAEATASTYGRQVERRVRIVADDVAAFEAAVTEATSGRVVARRELPDA